MPGPAITDSASLGRMRATVRDRPGTHDLLDPPARAAVPTTRASLDPAELLLALRSLVGPCSVRSVPAYSPTGVPSRETVPPAGALDGATMRLRDSTGGTVVVERPASAFTPGEFVRARSLVALDASPGPRQPYGQDPALLPAGESVTIRPVGEETHAEAVALHGRCSASTLRMRYHGPASDADPADAAEAADRYLGHLLSARFGRSLGAYTASGRLVGLGHLLHDGDEAEVALLVEDAWQRRGVGCTLLRRLALLAVREGRTCVYAVSGKVNRGMVAAMRELGLPLDYQVEYTTVVIAASLDRDAARALAPGGGSGLRAPGRPQR